MMCIETSSSGGRPLGCLLSRLDTFLVLLWYSSTSGVSCLMTTFVEFLIGMLSVRPLGIGRCGLGALETGAADTVAAGAMLDGCWIDL